MWAIQSVFRRVACCVGLMFVFGCIGFYGCQTPEVLEKQENLESSYAKEVFLQSAREGSMEETLMIMQQFSAARMNGIYIYLFFYEPGCVGCSEMEKAIDELAMIDGLRAAIIRVDRKNPENASFIQTMGAAEGDVPLLQLRDPENRLLAVTTDVPKIENMVRAIPSPKKAEAVACMREGKSLVLTIVNDEIIKHLDMTSKCDVLKEKMSGKIECITVNVLDPKENYFLEELGFRGDLSEPVTFVFNMMGQLSGKFTGDVSIEQIYQTATSLFMPMPFKMNAAPEVLPHAPENSDQQ